MGTVKYRGVGIYIVTFLCSCCCVKEEYTILKELYSFTGPGPDADEVRLFYFDT